MNSDRNVLRGDGHDVHRPLAAAYAASAGCPLVRRARDVIGSLYALEFLIHSAFVFVYFIY